MPSSTRISRGFHRLAVFLAGIPLMAGVAVSVVTAMENANKAQETHDQLLCAQQKIQQADKQLASRKTGQTMTYEQAAGTANALQQPTPHLDELLRQPPSGSGSPQQQPPQAADAGAAATPDQKRLEENPFWLLFAPDEARLNLKKIGCSSWDYETVSFGEARNPTAFNWLATLALSLAISLSITLGVSLAVYGLVRAIGWVIGGFAVS